MFPGIPFYNFVEQQQTAFFIQADTGRATNSELLGIDSLPSSEHNPHPAGIDQISTFSKKFMGSLTILKERRCAIF
jgi:hypothetical protein